MTDLTERQAEVLNYIKTYVHSEGYPPTRIEIAEAFEFKSPNAAQEHLRALVRKGAITLSRGVARGIRVLM